MPSGWGREMDEDMGWEGNGRGVWSEAEVEEMGQRVELIGENLW